MLQAGIRKRNRQSQLSLSEIMTLIIYFQFSKYRTFKDYYTKLVLKKFKRAFPGLVSYNRFVELMPQALLPLVTFLTTRRMGHVTGLSFIDSTPIRVCHNRRIHSHRVFKNSARRGKCSLGWFYGFKIHLIINDRGELLSVMLTPANVDDRDPAVIGSLTKNIFGKLFGDKGYISQKLFDMLIEKGVQLITKIKKNMKNSIMNLLDKILLRKRSIVESVNDELKNICYMEHTRHRSPKNGFINIIAALVAYTYLPKKPSLKFRDNIELLPVLV